jgi:hypothetical protein
MLRSRAWYLGRLGGPLLAPETEGGGGGQQAGTQAQQGGQQGQSGQQGQQQQSGQQGQQGGQQSGQQSQQQGVAFTPEQQAEINKLIGRARDEGRETAAAEAKRKADEEAAAAKGEWEKLARDRAAEVEAMKADIAKRDLADLRRTVATRHKLPADAAERLKGTTEAELDADAKDLAKLIGVREAPNTEAGAGSKAAGQNGKAQGGNQQGQQQTQQQAARTYDGKQKVAWPGN